MARFSGTPVTGGQEKKPRFGGTPASQQDELDRQRRRDVVSEARNAPWYQRGLQALDDSGRLAASGMTGGWADKIAAGLNTGIANVGSTVGLMDDTDYATQLAAERAATDDARTRVSSTYNEDPWSGEHNFGATAAEYGPALALMPSVAAEALPASAPWWLRGLGFAGEGAGWGALNASGHDGSAGDIAKSAAIGATLGAPLGVVAGPISKWVAGKVQGPYKTTAELERAAQEAGGPWTEAGADLAARAGRAELARVTQAGGRDAFRKMLSGMDEAALRKLPPAELQKMLDIARVRAGEVVNPLLNLLPSGKKMSALSVALAPFTAGKSMVVPAATKAAKKFSERAGQISRREMDELGALIRDPEGKGFRTDEASAKATRDFLARFMTGPGGGATVGASPR